MRSDILFKEHVRSTAFSLTLSKRMCAALIALKASQQGDSKFATVSALLLERATATALIERGLINDRRRLTRPGELAAEMVELAGFTVWRIEGLEEMLTESEAIEAS